LKTVKYFIEVLASTKIKKYVSDATNGAHLISYLMLSSFSFFQKIIAQ